MKQIVIIITTILGISTICCASHFDAQHHKPVTIICTDNNFAHIPFHEAQQSTLLRNVLK